MRTTKKCALALLQNSQILRSAIGGDLPYYLLSPEIAVLLSCCHDWEKRTLFEFLWNTSARINEAQAVRPADVEFDAAPAFVTLRTLKQRLNPRVGRPPALKLNAPGPTARTASPVKRTVALEDGPFAARLRDHIQTFTEHKTKPIWPVTDDTARNWLKKVLREADRQGARHPPHIPAQLCDASVVSWGGAADAAGRDGSKDFKSTQVYLKVFSLDTVSGRGGVPFSMDIGVATEMLQLADYGVKKVFY
ncbi:phage integrase family protein [Serratia marcescens]|uniref:phage integrase family protein n=1 Tax=Serratia marcescens TaxID=615 RepID=UPI003FA70324